MSKSDGGKGSSPRPFSVSNQTYAERWDAIFGRPVVQRCPRCEGEGVKVYRDVLGGADTTYKQCGECDLVWDVQ